MHLENLTNLAKMFTFQTKYFKLSSKCSKCRFKAFQNEINLFVLNFDIYNAFLILTEFGKMGKVGLNFGKTQLSGNTTNVDLHVVVTYLMIRTLSIQLAEI